METATKIGYAQQVAKQIKLKFKDEVEQGEDSLQEATFELFNEDNYGFDPVVYAEFTVVLLSLLANPKVSENLSTPYFKKNAGKLLLAMNRYFEHVNQFTNTYLDYVRLNCYSGMMSEDQVYSLEQHYANKG